MVWRIPAFLWWSRIQSRPISADVYVPDDPHTGPDPRWIHAPVTVWVLRLGIGPIHIDRNAGNARKRHHLRFAESDHRGGGSVQRDSLNPYDVDHYASCCSPVSKIQLEKDRSANRSYPDFSFQECCTYRGTHIARDPLRYGFSHRPVASRWWN